jgi:hypothetical protein
MAAAGEKQGKWKTSWKEAIEDAADEFENGGEGTFTVVETLVRVRFSSPGQVHEYRVKLKA